MDHLARIWLSTSAVVLCSCSLLLPPIGETGGGGEDADAPEVVDADWDGADGPRPDVDVEVDADGEPDVEADVEADADADPDIAPPVEICTNGADDDGDGLADCADPECDGAACGTGCSCSGGLAVETACSDAEDNDADGAADCGDPDCSGAPECRICGGAVAIGCGDSLRGDSATGGSRISAYGCAGYEDPGPEVFFSFVRAGTGTVQVTLDSDHTRDIDLIILGDAGGDCDPVGACVVASQTSDGWERVSFTATGGATYYFVVDSWRADTADSFALSVACW